MSGLLDTSLNEGTSATSAPVILSDVGNVGRATFEILSTDPFLDGEFYQKYIRISENPPSVNIGIFQHMGFDIASFQTELSQYIDKIYSNEYYFDGLDVASLELLLYGTLEEIKSKLPQEEGTLKIANMVKKVPLPPNVLRAIYDGEVRFSDRDRTQASYFPKNSVSKIYQMIGEDNMNNEEYIKMRKDYFHAFFWGNHRIKYHGTSQFLPSIDGKRRDFLDDILIKERGRIISEIRKPTPTINDTIKSKVSLKTDWRHPVVNGKTDFSRNTCTIPYAESGQCIFEITRGKLGIAGVNVDGSRIHPEKIKTIDPRAGLHDPNDPKISIIDEEGFTYVKALEKVFIAKIGSKFEFSTKRKYIGNIGGSGNIGSIYLPDDMEFELNGNIEKGFQVSVYSLTYSGDLQGEIHAKKDIHVKSGGILGGNITSVDGNITVDERAKVQNDSTLTVLNGEVTVNGNAEKTTFMADRVNIKGTATNCTIIARKVSVEVNNGSEIMAESMKIGKDIQPEKSRHTLLIYSNTERLIALAKKKLEDQTIQANESELLKTNKIYSFFDGNEILFTGPSVGLKTMRNPFIMSKELYKLLYGKDMLNDQKLIGYTGLLEKVTTMGNQRISYDGIDFTRGAILESLKIESTSNDHFRKDNERVVVYPRIIFPIVLDEDSWNLYDYSDNGCAIIIEKSKLDPSFSVAKDSHISPIIMGKGQDFIIKYIDPCFVVGEKTFYKVAGSFEEIGLGKDITNEINNLQKLSVIN